ncbi:MAG: hypothetical protein E5Y02_10400 [Mesorhizobium sp.]|nr:MAG: hypothetical protein E5Y02_10400 [Mesorhizobium sp.]
MKLQHVPLHRDHVRPADGQIIQNAYVGTDMDRSPSNVPGLRDADWSKNGLPDPHPVDASTVQTSSAILEPEQKELPK